MGPQFVIATSLPPDRSYMYDPAVSGNVVIWYEPVCSCVRALDMATGDRLNVGRGVSNYAVSGRRVVWDSYDSGSGSRNIYSKDLATASVVQITTGKSDKSEPAISGDVVVWVDYRNGLSNTDLYGKDLTSGREFPVVTANGSQSQPAIDGSLVVWSDNRNGNWDIYGKYLESGTEFVIANGPSAEKNPAVSGKIVVWSETPVSGWGGNIRAADMATGKRYEVVVDGSAASGPAIDGGLVAWASRSIVDGWGVGAYDLLTGNSFQVRGFTYSNPTQPAVAGPLVIWGGADGAYGDIYGRRVR